MTDTYDDDRGEGHKFATLQLHHGQTLDSDHRARAPPIYASTSFAFKDAEHGGKLFALQELGPIYTRIMNPTNHVLEYRISKLEGAPCGLDGAHPNALATASGMAAQMQALLTFMRAGDSFIASNELYGGTFAQFKHTFKDLGITCHFVDVSKPEEIAKIAAENPTVKAIYVETLSNPSYTVPDFEAIAKIANEIKVPFVVDNTFGMCGYTCRPFKFGVNIVVSSCTKWIGGHGNTIGGVIVDGSNFDWSVKMADGTSKFPLIADPCPAYHGLNFHAVFGPEGPFSVNMGFIFRARVVALRDMGGCPNPFGTFQLLMGLETLSLRCKAHSVNSNKLAAWLDTNESVEWVTHASLPAHPSHELAKKYFRKDTFGAVLCFGVKGGKDAAVKFINAVKLASHLANVGDAKTLVIHPASTTHQQLSETEQAECGVKPDMVRVSVGIEDYDDIVADFTQALAIALA